MDEKRELRPTFRIRCKSGEWLWMLTVYRDGVPFQITSGSGISPNIDHRTFFPEFLQAESAALKTCSLDVAKAYLEALIAKGFDAEIVPS